MSTTDHLPGSLDATAKPRSALLNRLSRLCLATAAALAVSCGGSSAPPAAPAVPAPSATTTSIGPAGGTVNGPYGAQIIIPPGALARTVDIGFARDSSNAPTFAVSDVDALGATYELTPHGTTFSLPVTVRIPYDPAHLPDEATPTLHKAESGGTFAALPTTVNGNFLEAAISAFSWVLPTNASSKPRAVYVIKSTGAGNELVSLRINPANGSLSSPTSAAATGAEPVSIVAHPSRRFLYVTHAGNSTVNNIAANSVATYHLSLINGQILGQARGSVSTGAALGFRPTMPTVHPSGKFLYVMNFGSVSNNGGGDISLFTIDGATGALTLSPSIASGNGSQPMGIAFNRLGTRAYVAYAGATFANPLASTVAVYAVDPVSGALTGPASTIAASAVGNAPWSIAIDPNGKFAYVATLFSDEVIRYSIDAATGALANTGSTVVTAGSKLDSLAVDSFGRFLFAGRQQPWLSKNLLAFQYNATSGVLSLANDALSACPGGACVGPLAVVAEPQGNFIYALDRNGGLASFSINAATGAMTPTGSTAGMVLPGQAGVSFPVSFAATGTSPVWQNNCTTGCAMTGAVTASTSGGGGGGASNPTPPTSFLLTVTQGAFFGFVSSTPAGIDYGPPTNSNPLGLNQFSARFPTGSSVSMCVSPPPVGVAYDVTWSGSCSGTGICASVTMSGDKDCHLNFQPR